MSNYAMKLNSTGITMEEGYCCIPQVRVKLLLPAFIMKIY